MSEYYYLSAQLPLLSFGHKAAVTKIEFLQEVSKWLVLSDLSVITKVDINDFTPHVGDPKSLRQYKEFENRLRNELALLRKDKKHSETSAISQLIAKGTPLAVEGALLKFRWDYIEELTEGHYFDLEFLILYLLKIQILERWFTFDKEKGIGVFDQLCEVSA